MSYCDRNGLQLHPDDMTPPRHVGYLLAMDHRPLDPPQFAVNDPQAIARRTGCPVDEVRDQLAWLVENGWLVRVVER